VLKLLTGGDMTDEEIKDALNAAAVNSKLRPSVETTFHSFLLSLPGVTHVGHTHPTAVNGILCSRDAEEIIQSRIFPDEIVYCGIRPIFIPYIDPGLKLARVIREKCLKFMEEQGTVPKVILMQNHGFVAIGNSTKDVEAITAMWVKTARVLAIAVACGGPHYFNEDNVNRIYSRPDEHYRQQVQAMLTGGK
jgi:rhamnose utilization protein RhaD (predicted bifunctional aldolase and dehydrogenase)